MGFYREVFDRLEGCRILSPDWTCLYLNDEAVRQARRSRQELIGRSLLDVFPGIERNPLFSLLQQCRRSGAGGRMTGAFDFGNGDSAWFEVSVERVPEGVLVLSTDITGRVRAMELARRLSRTHHVLANVNRAIVRIRNLGELFEKACMIAVNDGGFAMVWIGLTGSADRRPVPVASAGETAGYFDDGGPFNRSGSAVDSPIFAALREGKRAVRILQPPPSSAAPGMKVDPDPGFRSMASFPLATSDKIQGVLTLFSADRDCFDADELPLLDTLALDLSYAIEIAEKETGQEALTSVMSGRPHSAAACTGEGNGVIELTPDSGSVAE
jgi:PAS domain S-box-containing protein